MSGGHFDYQQYHIGEIANSIERLIELNDSPIIDDCGYSIGNGYSKETITEFKTAVNILRLANAYTQRIDYLVSGDDSEDSFHQRLNKELKELSNMVV